MATYYALHGQNGFGVYQDYEVVKRNKEFLSKSNCKKFKTADEAKHFAISKYNEHQDDGSLAIADPSMQFRLNWTTFRKDVIAENKSKT